MKLIDNLGSDFIMLQILGMSRDPKEIEKMLITVPIVFQKNNKPTSNADTNVPAKIICILPNPCVKRDPIPTKIE